MEFYKIFPDESKRKIAILYEKNNFVHIDVRANNFKYVVDLENEFEFWTQNMVGVDLNVLYADSINRGMENLGDEKD